MIAAIYAVMMLAALLVVLTPLSASAECAWVMWLRDFRTVPNNPEMSSIHWTAVTGTKTQQDCDELAAAGNADLKKTFPTDNNARYTCLPDTVDPRGAKGK